MNPRFNHYGGGRGFPIVPFVLGGVVGSLWANNNNNRYQLWEFYLKGTIIAILHQFFVVCTCRRPNIYSQTFLYFVLRGVT